MNKTLTIGLVLSGFVLIFTNPSKDAYVDSVSQKICSDSNDFSEVVKKIVCISNKGSIDTGIRLTTRRDNYLFFSFYVTKLPVIDTEYRTIGILGNFIPVK